MSSYQWWQNNGAGWHEEYLRRKRYFPYFHIQEIFLAELVSRIGPCRILEFGCGAGRHLRNLRQIRGAEVFGYDQSPTMIAEMRKWGDSEWIEEHVSIGAPAGPLPFSDQSFDIVFTSESLVHSNPDDLPLILKELVRISRRGIVHLEPTDDAALIRDAHEGCWGHDFDEHYRQLGLAVEKFRLFAEQEVLIVSTGGCKLDLPFAELTSRLFAEMARTLGETIDCAIADGVFEATNASWRMEQIKDRDALMSMRRSTLADAVVSLADHITKKEIEFQTIAKRLGSLLGKIENELKASSHSSDLAEILRGLEAHVAALLIERRLFAETQVEASKELP